MNSEGRVATKENPDHEHLVALYDTCVHDVYRYVHRLCLDHSVAEDVTQDVFVAAMRNPTVDISPGWLIRSARNRLIDIGRRDANYRDKVRILRPVPKGHDDDFGAVVEHLGVQDALARLRSEHRIVLMLHYVDDLPVAELATALGRSYKSIEGLLSRARAALRAELEDGR